MNLYSRKVLIHVLLQIIDKKIITRIIVILGTRLKHFLILLSPVLTSVTDITFADLHNVCSVVFEGIYLGRSVFVVFSGWEVANFCEL